MFSKEKRRPKEVVAEELRRALKTVYNQHTPQEKERMEQRARLARENPRKGTHRHISGSSEEKMSGSKQAHADSTEANERYISFLDRIEEGRKLAEANKPDTAKAGKYFSNLRSQYRNDPHLSDEDKESLERVAGIVTRAAAIQEYDHAGRGGEPAKKPGSPAIDGHEAEKMIMYGQVLAMKGDDHEANKQFNMVVTYIRSKYSADLSRGHRATLSKEDRNILKSLGETAGRLAEHAKDIFAKSEYQAAVDVATTLLNEGHDIPGYRHAKK